MANWDSLSPDDKLTLLFASMGLRPDICPDPSKVDWDALGPDGGANKLRMRAKRKNDG